MTGIEEYNSNIQRDIDTILDRQNDTCMSAFYSSLSDLQSLATKKAYIHSVEHFWNYIGKTDNFTYDDFQNYLGSLSDKSSSYRMAEYSALKRFSNFLYDSGRTEKNYMAHVKRPKKVETAKQLKKRDEGFLTEDEIKIVLYNVEHGVGSKRAAGRQRKWKNRDKSIIMIFLTTGIREAAMYKLDVSDYNPKKKTLTVTDKEAITDTFNLSDEMCETLNDWIKDRAEMFKGKYSEADTSAMFISNERTRLSPSQIDYTVRKYCKVDGKVISPHKLRATYATQLYNKTKDIMFVKDNMHHKSSRTTETYIRGRGNRTGKASDIMTSIIKG